MVVWGLSGWQHQVSPMVTQPAAPCLVPVPLHLLASAAAVLVVWGAGCWVSEVDMGGRRRKREKAVGLCGL